MDRQHRPPPDFHLAINPSRLGQAYCLAVTALAGLALALAGLPDTGRVVLALLGIGYAARAWHTCRVPAARGLSRIAGHWLLQGTQDTQPLSRLHPVFVAPWLVVVTCQPVTGRPLDLLLWPDSSDRQALRRLRVLLREGPTA